MPQLDSSAETSVTAKIIVAAEPAQIAWHRLSPIWQSNIADINSGPQASKLSPAWKLLLMSDGSVTRHLQVLTGESIDVDVIGMTPIGTETDSAPDFIELIPGPRLRRQVWLRTGSGQRLAYAASWWEESQVDEYLKNRNLPIWASMAAQKAELYRDIRQVVYGDSPELENAFQCCGPFWGRYYFFWHDQKPFTLIYEVFSPAIQQYLK